MSVTSTIANIAPMSIYNVLKGEHNEVRMIFKALQSTPNAEAGRRGLFDKLCNELMSHSVAEKQTLYVRLKERLDDQEITDQAFQEHADVEAMLEELQTMDITSEEWMTKLKTLEQDVESHVQFEEHTMFDQMRQTLSDEEADELGRSFRDVKNKELEMLKERQRA